MKQSLDLAFFPGFYETPLENCDTDYYAIKNELEYYQEMNPDLTEDDLDFDYEGYRKAIMEAFIDAWRDEAPKDVVENVEFDHLASPRYYNFENDDLYGLITFKEGWEDAMRNFMANNREWLRDRIHRQWSSRDGFVSFMSNDLNDWPRYLFNENDSRYLGTMIGYMMEVANPDVYDTLIMRTLDDVSDICYVRLKEKITV